MLGLYNISTIDSIVVVHGLINHIQFCVTLGTCTWLTVVVTLRTCARGKVIVFVVVVVVIVNTKIIKFGDLGI